MLFPSKAVKQVTSCFRRDPDNLLEPESHPLGVALITQRPRPCHVHWPVLRPAFTSRDQPGDSCQVSLNQAEQWLSTNEPGSRRSLPQYGNATVSPFLRSGGYPEHHVRQRPRDSAGSLDIAEDSLTHG